MAPHGRKYTKVTVFESKNGRTLFKVMDGSAKGKSLSLADANVAEYLGSKAPVSSPAEVVVTYGAYIKDWVSAARGGQMFNQQMATLSVGGITAKVTVNSVWNDIFTPLPAGDYTVLLPDNPHDSRMTRIYRVIGADGAAAGSELYRALVHNHAQLTYNGVAAWLDGAAPPPAKLAAVPGLDEQLRLQDRASQTLKELRRRQGALSLKTTEARPVFGGDGVLTDLRAETGNRAKELISGFMIAANGVTARYLDRMGFPSLRRFLREPARWQRIAEIAAALGERLPPEPSALATHSTAPNRRYPDLITQRLLKAALAGAPPPLSDAALNELAVHCTEQEDNAAKVERQVRKSAAALLLAPRIGQRFDAIVTGMSAKGTWVRISAPVAEGRVVQGFDGLDVGDKPRVELVGVDAARGFIDFRRVA